VDAFKLFIRWSLQKGFVPLPKSVQEQRLLANADAYSFELSDDEMAVIDSLDMGSEGTVTWNPVNAP